VSAPTSFPSISDRQRALEAVFGPWQPRTLAGMLDYMAARHPTRELVVSASGHVTYAQMRDWSSRLATGLRELGVRSGDRVAVVLANYPEFVAIKFAIARIGAVMVPVNFLNRRDELAYVLRQSEASVLVTMDRFRDIDYVGALDELSPGWETQGGGAALPALRHVVILASTGTGSARGARQFSSLERTAQKADASGGEPQAVSDIIYTSGTTGAPKGVMLTHDMLLRSGYGSAYARAFEDGRRILFSLPLYHVYGYVEGLLGCLFAGGAIILQERFDADDTLDAVTRHRASDLLLIPTMTLALIAAQQKKARDLSTLRAVISSGGRAPAYIWKQIHEWLGKVEITTGYGMTECTASTTVTRPDDAEEKLLSTNGRLRDVGVAAAGEAGHRLVQYRTVDAVTGGDVAAGEVGELIAKGPGVTAGYYNKPAETAAAFTSDGWLRTGDLARISTDGYLTLAGRLKESYRCGGETVLPSDAEDLLVLHDKVLQAFVVPIPDERMGEVGAAFIVLRPGSALVGDELSEYCRSRLARFKVPKYFLTIEASELPTTPSGRARKFLLTEMAVRRLKLQ
jgi:fatty-acyl-CoA synthase